MLDVPSILRTHQESPNNRGHIPDLMQQQLSVIAACESGTFEAIGIGV
jgi:hypothetical protein